MRHCFKKVTGDYAGYLLHGQTQRPTGQHPNVSPMLGIHHDGSRVRHLALYEGLAGLGSLLQPGHTDGLLGPVVSPVEVTSDPVHRDALHRVNACSTKHISSYTIRSEGIVVEPIRAESFSIHIDNREWFLARLLWCTFFLEKITALTYHQFT